MPFSNPASSGRSPNQSRRDTRAWSFTVASSGTDFDLDGKADLLWQHPTGPVSAWLMNGTTLKDGVQIFAGATTWQVVATGDFNGDSKTDIVWQDTNGDGLVTLADSSDFLRLTTSNAAVYAFTRPYADQNGMTVANFTGADVTVTVDATAAGALKFSGGIQPATMYYLNNLTVNTRQQIAGAALNGISVTLPPYGSAVYTISTTADTLKIANPLVGVTLLPTLHGKRGC